MSEQPEEPTPSPDKSQSQPTPVPAERSPLRALLGMLGQLGGILLAFLPLIWQALLKLLKLLTKGWAWLLPKIRTVLPTALKNLPDALLTAIALALLVLLIWIPTALSRSATASQSAPIEAPVVSKPDRNLARLTQLQTEIAEAVTQQAEPYGVDLVQTVQADFERKQLTVSLAERWYGLSGTERQKVAGLLLKQAKKQGFNQLEVIDPQGVTLARPAVVGSGMVVLAGA